jgi:hypothetical protein
LPVACFGGRASRSDRGFTKGIVVDLSVLALTGPLNVCHGLD